MKKKYPPKNAATCIVCEDIRAEATGKLILIGVYPGESINFFKKPTEDSPGRINLALSFWFRKGSGTFQSRLAIVGPSDEIIVDRDVGEQVAETGKILATAVKFQNAEFVAHGDYTIIFALDDNEYHFPLQITYSNEE